MNVKVHISNKLKKVNRYNLFQSIIFFASDVFEKYAHLFDKLIFSIDAEEKASQGWFFVLDKDLYFQINYLEVQKAVDAKMCFASFTRSILFNILHEIGHGLILLEEHTNNKNISLEEFYEQINDRMGKEIEKIKKENENIAGYAVSRMLAEEIKCDRYAYSKLSYFENLYKFRGILI